MARVSRRGCVRNTGGLLGGAELMSEDPHPREPQCMGKEEKAQLYKGENDQYPKS